MTARACRVGELVEQLRKRGEALGAEHIKQVEQEWPQLIARVRAAMQSGMDPASAEAQGMARRWMELIHMFTGGDPGIERSLSTMYQQEPGAGARFLGAEGPPLQDMMGFVRQALGSAKPGS